ncbi:lysophospholipase [Hasllibacter halocynthiae]|uniref:Lysophospholipase n=1 Tax=Hasllibacter halocynthiae TaxID=595589 RepID=A0A2T0X721_9RHOB|nr:alpha/beta hydrolase [Hasllibacter halocynthiae]PRY94750.1 lysophospholipase [Hasllibacter halocynthiae]
MDGEATSPGDAPFHRAVARPPAGDPQPDAPTRARWIRAADGVRLRTLLVGPQDAAEEVLILPGRTEYVEKYWPTALWLASEGFRVLAIDWRGQGLSDRLDGDPALGHVVRFEDYQRDVAALVSLCGGGRRHLLAHSMGGCIGLRALGEGLSVATATFSAPMWGIEIARHERPFAWALSWLAGRTGRANRYAPGRGPAPVADVPAEAGMLTTDEETLDWMRRQTAEVPALALGGPSLGWLWEALREMRRLHRAPSPDVPCLTGLGTAERVVDPARIRSRMARWPGGRLVLHEGGEHELLMERPALRDAFRAQILAHLRR